MKSPIAPSAKAGAIEDSITLAPVAPSAKAGAFAELVAPSAQAGADMEVDIQGAASAKVGLTTVVKDSVARIEAASASYAGNERVRPAWMDAQHSQGFLGERAP